MDMQTFRALFRTIKLLITLKQFLASTDQFQASQVQLKTSTFSCTLLTKMRFSLLCEKQNNSENPLLQNSMQRKSKVKVSILNTQKATQPKAKFQQDPSCNLESKENFSKLKVLKTKRKKEKLMRNKLSKMPERFKLIISRSFITSLLLMKNKALLKLKIK